MTVILGFILSIVISFDIDYGISMFVRMCKKTIVSDNGGDKRDGMLSGLIVTLIVLLVTTAVCVVVNTGLYLIAKPIGFIGEMLIFAMLLDTAKIIKRVKSCDDDAESVRAVCEKTAEELEQRIVATVCYMAVGGVWLAVIYRVSEGILKAVESENADFSRFPIRLCEILEFIPSRISAVFAMGASRMLGYNYKKAIEIFWRDRLKGGYRKSNTKAVFAGALGISFGSDAKNFDDYINNSSIGDNDKKPHKSDVKKTLNMMYLTSVFTVIAGSMVRFIFT